MKKLIAVMLAAVMALALVGCGSSGANSNSTKTQDVGSVTEGAASVGIITAEKYDEIKFGMSYQEVKAVIGADGEKTSDSEFDGVKTSIYQWDSENYGNIVVTFEDDSVAGKSQAGIIEESEVAVTAEQYGKVENGMSYKDVEKIMGGSGVSLSESKFSGETLEVFLWSGVTSGSNCTITFENGKVIDKTEFDLAGGSGSQSDSSVGSSSSSVSDSGKSSSSEPKSDETKSNDSVAKNPDKTKKSSPVKKEKKESKPSKKPEFHIYDAASVRPMMNGVGTDTVGEYSVIFADSQDCTEENLADWYYNYISKNDYNYYLIVYNDDESKGCYGNSIMIAKDVDIEKEDDGQLYLGDEENATHYGPSEDGKTLIEYS